MALAGALPCADGFNDNTISFRTIASDRLHPAARAAFCPFGCGRDRAFSLSPDASSRANRRRTARHRAMHQARSGRTSQGHHAVVQQAILAARDRGGQFPRRPPTLAQPLPGLRQNGQHRPGVVNRRGRPTVPRATAIFRKPKRMKGGRSGFRLTRPSAAFECRSGPQVHAIRTAYSLARCSPIHSSSTQREHGRGVIALRHDGG